MRYILKIVFLAVLVVSGPTAVPAEEPAVEEKPPDVKALIANLGSPEAAVKLQARALLAGLGEEAGPALLAALPSAGDEEAGELVELLALIRYRPAVEAVETIWQKTGSVPLKLKAAQALCRFDHNYSRYQGYILSQARSGKEEDRLTAMQQLGYLEDRRVVEPLAGIFNDPEQPDQIRQAAIWDLAHTPVRESAEVLVGLVNDPEVDWFYKEIVIAAIRRLAGQEDMAPIVSELLERAQGLPRR